MRFAFYFLFLIFLPFTISIQGCGGSNSSSPDFGISSQNCGNASIDAAESCDDGNGNNSDGCNANCAWEVGEAICGNGVKENEECCDDGNNLSGDGCSIVCTSEKNNRTPAAPQLSVEPANGVTWAPTRLYLSWNPSADLDAGDQVTYDVYFILKGSRESIPAGILPYKTGIASTHFIIQASTDNRAEYFPDQVSAIYLSPDNSYLWKVCARDSSGAQNCSETRTFNTDNSVVGWWRFDENSGQVCPSILGGPAGDPGETVCDYSGFGNHGREFGSPERISFDQPQIIGGALKFDGIDDWIEVENDNSLNPESISIITKIKLSDQSSEQQIIDKRQNGAGYNLRVTDYGSPGFPAFLEWVITSNNLPEQFMSSAMRNLLSSTVYMFSASFNVGESKAITYLNGDIILETVHPIMDRIEKSTGPLVIGDMPHTARPSIYNFKGFIGEVIIFNNAINRQQIINNNESTK